MLGLLKGTLLGILQTLLQWAIGSPNLLHSVLHESAYSSYQDFGTHNNINININHPNSQNSHSFS